MGASDKISNLRPPRDGEQGEPGSVFRVGTGLADNGLGVNNDFYLNSLNGDLYKRIANFYVFQCNLWPNLATKADLVNGKIPAEQLPASVDDVLQFEGIVNFPAVGESNIIYLDTVENKPYRWGGSSYIVLTAGAALGETSSTAYRGDRGKIAYDHSQSNGNPHNTTIGDIPGLAGELNNRLTLNGSELVENKRIIPRVSEDTNAANFTPNFTDNDICCNIGMAQNCSVEAPEIDSPEDKEVRCLIFKDDNVARTITWHGSYANFTDTLPNTTIAGKETKVYLEYSSATTKFMCLSVLIQI